MGNLKVGLEVFGLEGRLSEIFIVSCTRIESVFIRVRRRIRYRLRRLFKDPLLRRKQEVLRHRILLHNSRLQNPSSLGFLSGYCRPFSSICLTNKLVSIRKGYFIFWYFGQPAFSKKLPFITRSHHVRSEVPTSICVPPVSGSYHSFSGVSNTLG